MQSDSMIDLSPYIRAGDAVLIGQGCGEPVSLSQALMAQRAQIGRISVLLATVVSDHFRVEHADWVEFQALGISGGSRALAKAGVVEIIPCHFSDTEALLRSGRLRCDVVMLQVSPPGPDGRYSLGATHDYLVTAVRCARAVIAEVNHNAPQTHGSHSLAREDFTLLVDSERPLLEMPVLVPSESDRRIGLAVAELVPERATLQVGVGTIPDAVLDALRGHRGLGVHSGMLSDRIADLVECGVVDNAHKIQDRGVTVTGVLLGTRRLFDFAHRNPALAMRSPDYSHSALTLARTPRLTAINSALEVDLSGQVNAESLGGRYLGAIGGQVDFMRGSRLSEGGQAIIAMSATQGPTRRSRIVPRLSGAVTTARSDVDFVVTEWGRADLRGRTLRQRVRAMVDIAHPEHREQLEAAAHMWLHSATGSTQAS